MAAIDKAVNPASINPQRKRFITFFSTSRVHSLTLCHLLQMQMFSIIIIKGETQFILYTHIIHSTLETLCIFTFYRASIRIHPTQFKYNKKSNSNIILQIEKSHAWKEYFSQLKRHVENAVCTC